MSKSVIRSERGGETPDEDEVPARSVLKMPEKQPIIFTRTLFDFPKIPSPPRNEIYRRATPEEVSKPTEFMAYMRDARPAPEGYKKTRFRLPEQQPLEALHAVNQAQESKVVQPPSTQAKNRALSDEDIPRLRQQWYEEFKDILQGTPEVLPPLREVNHEINLIDPDKKYTHRLPTCPVALRPQFHEKLNRYVRAGWWKDHPAPQAAPLICLPKKDGRLRTVIDARQRNENTVKDITPLPDQDIIREDVARAKYRSKIDLADVYEQVRIEPKDVQKSAFSTIC